MEATVQAAAQVTTEEEQATQERISSLLKRMPLDSLRVVEQFVRFLNDQARNGRRVAIQEAEPQKQPPYKYPTVALPATFLDGWVNLLQEGYDGDALMDTEALYDGD
jgi:hypothetical protein